MIPVPNPAPPVQLPPAMILSAFAPKVVNGVTCQLRAASIPEHCSGEMRGIWARNKRSWLARGFSMRPDGAEWKLMQWLATSPELHLTEIGEQKLREFDQPAAIEKPATAPVIRYRAPAAVFAGLPDSLQRKLYGYQIQPATNIFWALSHGRDEWGYPGAVDLSDMGTGKTYMDLAAAIATGRKIIVVCPTVGENGWRKAFAHFGAEPHFITTYEALRGNWRQNIVSIDEEKDRFEWHNRSSILLILDEIQSCRHQTSLTFKLCSAAIRQGIPIIAASATIATSPLEYRFAGRITGLHNGENDWIRFLAQHGCRQFGQTWKWDQRMSHLVKINHQLFPGGGKPARGARVRKEDLGDECPETEISLLPFDVPEGRQIIADFQEAQEMIQAMWDRRESPKLIAMKERNIRMKVWHRCEMALVPYVGAHAKAKLIEGYSTALFCNFNDSRIALGKYLNFKGGFYGGQSPKVRKYWEDAFQANRELALVSNIGAGGASVSLHDVNGRPRCAYIFPTDQVVKMAQATGRVDRVGGESKSFQFIPFVKGALVETMVERTRVKMMRIKTLNDGVIEPSKIV